MRDLETKMKTAPHITDAFHLCSDVPALCPHMYFIRCPQHSMNHREQFSLSFMSETVFNFRTLCCPLGIPSAKSGEFEQHDSLRLKQLLVYSCVTRDNSTVTCGGTMGGTVRLSYCDVLVFVREFATVAAHQRNTDIVTVTEQVYVIQTFQKATEIPQLQYIDNMIDISVVGIVQVPRVRVMTKTDEIPQSQCIDESINDSGVRAPQVLIVEKTVENSQLR